MDFLEQLIKSKDKLKPTETVVTRQDGRCYVINPDGSLETKCSVLGFVVDDKPDIVPAEIVTHLYLGSQDCCDLSILQEYNIKYVLSIGIDAPVQYPQVVYKFVQCLDLPETNVVTVLKNECLEFIKYSVANGINILVHCNAGVSRSPTIVIGYLILVYNLSYMEAYSLVHSKRPCIKPNCGFDKQLKLLK